MNIKPDMLLPKAMQASSLLAALHEEKSFSKAANKLNIHQSAVSHRIKLLEETLGYPLFERTTRQLSPTPYGEILCQCAAQTVERWQEALHKINTYQQSDAIRLSMSSSVAMKWLLPLLGDAKENGLDIALDVNDDETDFERDPIDVTIRFGQGPYPGLHSTHLSKSQLYALASPTYLEKHPDPENILTSPDTVFLSDRTGAQDQTEFNWEFYFFQNGLRLDEFKPDHVFDRADLMLQACISGAGVGLGRTLLIETDIKMGLLTPIRKPISMHAGYWLVCPPAFAKTQRFQQLHDWLKSHLN